MNEWMRAPFPYFGGKRRVADLVWEAFGDTPNYCEPFCGSMAVLLGRPLPVPMPSRIETVNDLDCAVANFWRAVKFAAHEVAEWADWPVNEADLHARHRWLVEPESYARFRKQMRSDPDFYDVQRAGWWVWGLSMWIGSGWCAQPAWEEQAANGAVKTLGIHTGDYEKRPMLDKPGRGVHQEGARPVVRGSTPSEYNVRPDLSGFRGTTAHRMRDLSRAAVWEKRPSIGDGAARGVHADHLRQARQLPDLSGDSGAAGRGVHASGLHQKLPSLAGAHGASGRGVHASGQRESGGDAGLLDEIALTLDAEATGHQTDARGGELRSLATRLRQFIQINPGLARGGPLYQWFGALQERLRYVRVCCGDWKRVLGKSVTWKIGRTGILFDPPYSHAAGRDPSIYAQEDLEVAHEVRDWCLENGNNPNLRIAYCSYGEAPCPPGWQRVKWKAVGGYAAAAGNTENSERETIDFSPACLPIRGPPQLSLFDVGGGAVMVLLHVSIGHTDLNFMNQRRTDAESGSQRPLRDHSAQRPNFSNLLFRQSLEVRPEAPYVRGDPFGDVLRCLVATFRGASGCDGGRDWNLSFSSSRQCGDVLRTLLSAKQGSTSFSDALRALFPSTLRCRHLRARLSVGAVTRYTLAAIRCVRKRLADRSVMGDPSTLGFAMTGSRAALDNLRDWRMGSTCQFCEPMALVRFLRGGASEMLSETTAEVGGPSDVPRSARPWIAECVDQPLSHRTTVHQPSDLAEVA